MDQVRKILAWLKQYHFWVLSVFIVFIALFCWYTAAGDLSRQYDENQKKIKAEFTNIDQTLSDSFHPNDEINRRQVEETSKLASEVQAIWQQLYDKQREEVLKWPAELGAEFGQVVDKLEFGQEIPSKWREHYQNYITRHFPELAKKIGAPPLDENATGAGGGEFFSRGPTSYSGEGAMSAGQMEADDFICLWDPASQSAVRADLEFPQQPSPLRIWWTQENLWVYHALLDAIRNTNTAVNATRVSNAAVRNIISLEVGQRAAPFSRTPNRIYKLPTATPGVEGDPMAMAGEVPPSEFGATGEAPPMSEFSPTGPDGSGQMSDAQEQAFLFNGRYLGPDGKPIPAGGAAGMDMAAADPAAPAAAMDMTIFGKEFKRLPVRLVLVMDQRQLPTLIAECAMRPLQIEVQEVRVNPADLQLAGGGGSEFGSMGAFRGGGPSIGGGTGELMIPDLTGLQEFNPQPNIATVVIQGVIYIFNKPNAEILKPEGGASDAPLTAQVQ